MRLNPTVLTAFGVLASALLVVGVLAARSPATDDGKVLGASGADAEPTVLPAGPSFRVETEVFEGDSVQPAARHLVLFDSGVIYDFRLDSDRFASMYDPARNRVVLVDRRNRQQTTISTESLLSKTAQLRAAVTQEGKADKFGLTAVVAPALAANPGDTAAFEIAFGETRYTTTTQSGKTPNVARAYNHFATMAAQLNVAQGLGAPPFARMTLGQHLADAGLLPLRTELEVRLGLKKERWKSQLYLVEQLAVLDRQRISEFGQFLSTCETVEFEAFGK